MNPLDPRRVEANRSFYPPESLKGQPYRCKGKTKTGGRCHTAANSSGYCHHHQDQAEKNHD